MQINILSVMQNWRKKQVENNKEQIEYDLQKRKGRLGQIQIYVMKFLRIFWYEKGWKVILFSVIVSGILAYVLREKIYVEREYTRTALFAMVCAMLWVGIFNSIQNVCREREIIKREHRTGLHISAYVTAHVIFQAGICVIQAALMLLIYSITMEFPSKGAVTGNFYLDMFICFFLILFSADMLGLAISSVVRNTTIAMTVLPFVLIVQLIFGGVIFTLHGSVKKLSDFTLSKWDQQALMVEADMNNIPSRILQTQIKKFKKVKPDWAELMDEIPDEMIEKLSSEMTYDKKLELKAEPVIDVWEKLLLFSVVFMGISVLSLEFIDKDKR